MVFTVLYISHMNAELMQQFYAKTGNAKLKTYMNVIQLQVTD